LQLWPSHKALLASAARICDASCEPTYDQRIQFGRYNWPLQVFQNRQILAAFWLGLFYIFSGWAAYRSLFARSAHPAPAENPPSGWKPFAAASGLGGLVVGLALLGILAFWLTELFYFGKSPHFFPGPDLNLPLLFVSPLGLWSVVAYSHFTRSQPEHRVQRMLLAWLAWLTGYVFFVLCVMVSVVSIPIVRLLTLPLIFVAVTGSILGIAGAALYIYVVQPRSSRALSSSPL
jgi:hypothetical protein